MLHKRTVEKLVQLVEQRWDEHHLPLFYSQIPDLLMKAGVDIRVQLNGEKLSRGINAIGTEKIRIVTNPSDPKILALIPSHVKDSDKDMFSRHHAQTKEKINMRHPRYERIVWSAFITPLLNGERFLIFENGLHYEDQAIDATTPPGGFLVPNEYIRKPDENLPSYEVARRIEQWVKMHGIPRDSIVFAESIRRNLLEFGKFSELDVEDQMRIMIPLDIVMKVIQK